MVVRPAGEADERAVTDALATAFAPDPVWGWAVPDPAVRPANLGRYTSVGFRPRDELRAPNGQIITTMWRPAPSDAG